jgi:uncharacterized protein (DUF1697 family)
MTAYVALLRGINVGGHAKLSMADLRSAFSDLGYGEVRTYIQSGNVVFEAAAPAARLQPALERDLEARFGLGIKVVLRSRVQLGRIIDSNPLATGKRDRTKLHVTFLGSKPAASRPPALDADAFLPDEFRVVGQEVYLHCPEGYGRTKLNNTFFERAFAVTATTRTWKTVTTLIDITG